MAQSNKMFASSIRSVTGLVPPCVRNYRAASLLFSAVSGVKETPVASKSHRIYRPADPDAATKKTPASAKQRQRVQPSDELLQLHKEFNEAMKSKPIEPKEVKAIAPSNKAKMPHNNGKLNSSRQREKPSRRVLFAPKEKSALTISDTPKIPAHNLQQQKQLNRIYVGNLSYKVTNKAFSEFVSRAGKVNYAEVLKDEFGVSKGCGIAEYETISEANAAILQLHDMDLLGRKVFVREDREEFILRPKDPNLVDKSFLANSVFVGNIHPSVTRYEFKRHMSKAGEVAQVNITYDRKHFFTGSGIVVYKTIEGMRKAVTELHETKLKKQLIFVREDREKIGYEKTQLLKIKSQKNSEYCAYISNLPFRATEAEIAETMSAVGNVRKVVLWETSGRPSGNGTVEFESIDSVNKLLSLPERLQIHNRKIAVRPYTRPGHDKEERQDNEDISSVNRLVKASGSL